MKIEDIALLTNEQKIKFLKQAKKELAKFKSMYESDKEVSIYISKWDSGLCLILSDLVNKKYNLHFGTSLSEVQELFDMEIVKPRDIDGRGGFWWYFTMDGYLSRMEALDVLIEHFKKKLV